MPEPALAPLRAIAEERGVFLRRDAIAFEVPDKILARAVRSGELTRVRHGSYTFSDLWTALNDEGRHLIAGRAVMRRVQGIALSHITGSIAHGLDVWDVDLSRVHVTRLDGAAGRTEPDLVHHEGFSTPNDLCVVHGVTAVAPARAALETALLVGVERGLIPVCSGLHRGLYSPSELARQHESMSSWPGAQPLQIVARLADGAYESVGEVRSIHLFWRCGLPHPVPQHEVYDDSGRLLARVDFAWPEFRLIVEFDGAEKYLRYARPGETPGEAVFREKRREDALRGAGWNVVRITWADLYAPRETAERIRSAMRRAA